MKITKHHIVHIEKALNFKLYPDVVNYLVNGTPMPPDRRSGRTTAYIIRLALSDGGPLDYSKPWKYSDGWELRNHKEYAVTFFLKEFLYIGQRLKDYGFKVREIEWRGMKVL